LRIANDGITTCVSAYIKTLTNWLQANTVGEISNSNLANCLRVISSLLQNTDDAIP
jgi:hypothetical protein